MKQYSLKMYLKLNNISVSTVAYRLNVNKLTVYSWLRGDTVIDFDSAMTLYYLSKGRISLIGMYPPKLRKRFREKHQGMLWHPKPKTINFTDPLDDELD